MNIPPESHSDSDVVQDGVRPLSDGRPDGKGTRLLHANAIARTRAGRWIGPLLAANLILFMVAWFMPIMTISKFWFWKDTASIWDTVALLWKEDEIFIFLIVGVFSMLFPAVKLLVAGWVWARVDAGSAAGARSVGLLEILGKWSMVDVFVVALVVVAVKVSLVTNVTVHSGIYMFTGAALFSILLLVWIGRRLRGSRTA
jgi:paraquat-inducible protein A